MSEAEKSVRNRPVVHEGAAFAHLDEDVLDGSRLVAFFRGLDRVHQASHDIDDVGVPMTAVLGLLLAVSETLSF